MASNAQDRAKELISKVGTIQACTDIPAEYWITFSGVDTQTSQMVFYPNNGNTSGNVWICYEYNGTQTPPELTLYTDDGNGYQSQSLPTGQTTFQTDNSFFIYYDLGSSGAGVKLGYSVS